MSLGDLDGPDDFAPPLFYRRESSTQTVQVAQRQVESGEIWGRAPRYSDAPTVQAYRGALPGNTRGIEFRTDVPPDPGSPPRQAQWTGPRPGVRVEGEFAKITVEITRNTQV